MEKYFRSFALIANEQRTRWLTVWEPFGETYGLVRAERQGDESFRDCLLRKVRHALKLEARDVLIANMAQLNVEFSDRLPGECQPRHIAVAFYPIHLYSRRGREKIERDEELYWATGRELTTGRTELGQRIDPVTTFLLVKSDVLGPIDSEPPTSD